MLKTLANRSWRLPLATIISLCPATATATPPTGSDFEVTYFRSDGTPMDETDRLTYANRARCECDAPIEASVYLPPGDWDNVIVRTFVGNRCHIGAPWMACGVMLNSFSHEYADAATTRLHPLWLAAPPAEPGTGPGSGTPAGDCSAGAGQAGIWICVEDGRQTDCQPEELTSPQTPLSYDFEPPAVSVEEFWLEDEDGQLVAHWNIAAAPNVHGFQLLCADTSGRPISNIGASPPARPTYYTSADLCPDDSDPSGIESLRWAYRCSEPLPPADRASPVSGLPANAEVDVLLVAYDQAGNPVAASQVERGIKPPDAGGTDGDTDGTHDTGQLGDRGCSCSASKQTPLGIVLVLLGGLAACAACRRGRRRLRPL